MSLGALAQLFQHSRKASRALFRFQPPRARAITCAPSTRRGGMAECARTSAGQNRLTRVPL